MHQDAIIYIHLSILIYFNLINLIYFILFYIIIYSIQEANLFKYSFILKKFVKEIEQTLQFKYENKDIEYYKIIDFICIRKKFKRYLLYILFYP